MEGKNLFFKATAVIGALAIGGSFVAWRGGKASDAKLRELNRKAAWAELEKIDAEKGAKMPHPDSPEIMLPSSKSIVMPIFSKRLTKDPIEIFDGNFLKFPQEKKAEQRLLPSSKSGIFIPEKTVPGKSD